MSIMLPLSFGAGEYSYTKWMDLSVCGCFSLFGRRGLQLGGKPHLAVASISKKVAQWEVGSLSTYLLAVCISRAKVIELL